jgi:hypothetical protein
MEVTDEELAHMLAKLWLLEYSVINARNVYEGCLLGGSLTNSVLKIVELSSMNGFLYWLWKSFADKGHMGLYV